LSDFSHQWLYALREALQRNATASRKYAVEPEISPNIIQPVQLQLLEQLSEVDVRDHIDDIVLASRRNVVKFICLQPHVLALEQDMKQTIGDFPYHQKSFEHIVLQFSGLPVNKNGLVNEEGWMWPNLLSTEITTLDEDLHEPSPVEKVLTPRTNTVTSNKKSYTSMNLLSTRARRRTSANTGNGSRMTLRLDPWTSVSQMKEITFRYFALEL
jgi:hypothetical protein